MPSGRVLSSVSMTAQFRWVEADYVSAQWARIKRHPLRLAASFRYVISVFLIVVIAGIANQKWHALLVVFVDALLLVVLGLLLQRWRWHRSFKKTPLFREEVSATIDRQSVKLRGRSFEATHDWGEFAEVYESTRVFLLERANDTFLFLPKTHMIQSQADELREIISAGMKRKRNLSPTAG